MERSRIFMLIGAMLSAMLLSALLVSAAPPKEADVTLTVSGMT